REGHWLVSRGRSLGPVRPRSHAKRLADPRNRAAPRVPRKCACGSSCGTRTVPRPVPETPIVYQDVELLEQDGLGFTCRIGNERVFIGKYVPLVGTTIRTRGDRGRLALPRWFVE